MQWVCTESTHTAAAAAAPCSAPLFCAATPMLHARAADTIPSVSSTCTQQICMYAGTTQNTHTHWVLAAPAAQPYSAKLYQRQAAGTCDLTAAAHVPVLLSKHTSPVHEKTPHMHMHQAHNCTPAGLLSERDKLSLSGKRKPRQAPQISIIVRPMPMHWVDAHRVSSLRFDHI